MRIGRYEIVRRIGSGGMAEVFAARMKGPEGFEKEVCIKRILPQLCDHPGFEAMFLEEARIAATLRHANIVQVFDFDRDEEGSYFIVMELVDGTNLKTLMFLSRRSGRHLEPGFAVSVASSVLAALHHAWTKEVAGKKMRVVHRDLSPHNILVSSEGEIKLTDFGIAKAINSAVKTRSGVIKGKLAYMSPEQALGMPLDHRSDLYSLGVVLWELLSGKRLFERASKEKTPPTTNERANVPCLSKLRKDVPRQLDAFVMKLLSVDPKQRYQSALYAMEELERMGVESFSPIKTARLLKDLGWSKREGRAVAKAREEISVGAHQSASAPPLEMGGGRTVSLPTPYLGVTLASVATGATDSMVRGGTPQKGWKGQVRGRIILLVPVLVAVTLLVAAAVALLLGGGSSILRGGGKTQSATARPLQQEALGMANHGTEISAVVSTPLSDPPPVTADDRKPGDMVPGEIADSGATSAGEVALPSQPAEGHGSVEDKGETGTVSVSRGGIGWLTINARPWAEVTIGRKRVGFTPLVRFPLPAGIHKVVLTNPKLGVKKAVRVKVTHKKEKKISFDLTNCARSGGTTPFSLQAK